MQPGQIVFVRTDPATQFTAAINQDAIATLVMEPPAGAQQAGPGYVDGGLAAGGTCRGTLRSLAILSVQPIAWELSLWGNDLFNSGDITTERFLGKYNFAAADGLRYGGAGLYHYFASGLDIYNINLGLDAADRSSGKLYLGLSPRTAGGKAANADGRISIQMGFLPTLGW